MLHTHEVTGSSPVVSTKRISVTVAHRTLTPFAGVRIPHPLPKIADTHSGICYFYLWWWGIRTILDADVQWTSACRRSRRRQHLQLFESLILCPWCTKLFETPWENPWTYERTQYGCGHKSILQQFIQIPHPLRHLRKTFRSPWRISTIYRRSM